MRQGPLRIVEPPLSTGERMSVNDPLTTLGNTGSGRSTTNQLAAREFTQSAARGPPVLNAGSGCIQHMEEILGLFLDAKTQAFIETLRGIDLQHL